MSSGRFFQLQIEPDYAALDILQPVGSLADAEVMRDLDRVLTELRSSEVRQIVVDFHQTPYFGSSMLEALRLVWNTLHEARGQMVLCNLSPVGREIIEVARFDRIWPVLADRTEALAQLRKQVRP